MSLSPHDRAYYENKLGWKAFLLLLALTVFTGAVILPGLFFMTAFISGQTHGWTGDNIAAMSLNGVYLGLIISAVMYGIARLYLHMGWLPPRN